MKRIALLYRIEADIRGQDPATRLVMRQERAAPVISEMQTWLTQARTSVSGKSPLGEALSYIAKHWEGLCLFLNDGCLELVSNLVERTGRTIAFTRKNALFAGRDAGAENWALIASLIETAKLNDIDPLAYLTHTLNAISNRHRQSEIAALLPWNFATRQPQRSD